MAVEIDHLSYSSVGAFLECPRRWRYHYVDRVPTVGSPALAFGSALHGTIEESVRQRHAGRTPDLQGIWLEEWGRAARQEIAWDGALPEALANDGVRLVAAIRPTLEQLVPAVDDDGPIVERKIAVRVPGVPVPVIGYLDFLGADGVLRDFKTAGRAWSDATLREQSQPLVYLAAANQMGLPHAAGRFEHVVFVKTRTPQVQLLPSEHSMTEVLWMFSVIRGVWEAISRGWFPPNPKACFNWGRRCEFWELCRGKG